VDIKKIRNFTLTAALILMLGTQSYAAKNDDLIEMPKTYPAKYTSQYVKQITPIYKPTGKNEVIYVALDMLKGTNGVF